MISPIGSGYSSPVSIQVPENLSEIQDSSLSTSSEKKAGRIRTGVAEYRDSFEQAPVNKANNLESKRINEFRLELHLEDEKRKLQLHYEKVQVVVESQKAEQAKGYRPDQQGVTLHPSVTPVANVSLAADLSANMLSMIRV